MSHSREEGDRVKNVSKSPGACQPHAYITVVCLDVVQCFNPLGRGQKAFSLRRQSKRVADQINVEEVVPGGVHGHTTDSCRMPVIGADHPEGERCTDSQVAI